jgi:mannose-6-phosphate isomerase
MSELYPLLLKPEFSPRPWGARSLAPIYQEFPNQNGEPIGESWLTGENCRIANGPLAPRTLGDAVRQFGRDLIGETAPQADHFPLLMKFLFPRDRLSVQVHPDDEGAHRIGQPCGKTECWYVLAAEPGAQIGLGLKPGTTLDELKRAIDEVRAETLLNWIDVKPGEMYYVDAGTVHAIGPGSILVETQQNSDTTFRLYDYGRPRELHVESGLAATKEATRAGKVLGAKPPVLVASPYFVVEKHSLVRPQVLEVGSGPSAECLVATSGCGVVDVAGHDPVTFARGEAVVIPASVGRAEVRPQWELDLIRAHVPETEVAVPTTAAVSSGKAVVGS